MSLAPHAARAVSGPMTRYRYLPVWLINRAVLLMCAVVLGDTSRYCLRRPAMGPFSMKPQTPTYPVIDVGTYAKIKAGKICVLQAAIKSVHGDVVEFIDGRRYLFDAIVFATDYGSTTK